MSGHSKWSQIKHQKGTADQKRGQLFSKLARIITLAARGGNDPTTNTTLKNAIDQARRFDLPKDNIDRAIKRASEKEAASLEELIIQAIGPGGSAIVIKAITDSKNRTVAELKNVLSKNGTKLVTPGSLNWQFDAQWNPTVPLQLNNPLQRRQLEKLFNELDEHPDVEEIYSNLRD